MIIFSWLFTLAIIAIAAWMVYNTVAKYRATEGPFWERLRAGSRDSAVILWSYMLWVAGTVISYSSEIAIVANAPEVSNLINKLPPAWLGYALLAISAINILSRLRSL